MSQEKKYSSQLLMRRPNLDGLPRIELPEGYRLRTFRPGDQGAWNDLMDAVFERPPGSSDFDKQMAADAPFRPERVFLIEHEGELAASASAWYRPEYGRDAGCVHWVACHPKHRGKKLGAWATWAVLHQFKKEGRAQAVLQTDDFRLAAIKTYLRMGFQPLLMDETHAARWRAVLEQLQYPESFEAILSGPLFQPLPQAPNPPE